MLSIIAGQGKKAVFLLWCYMSLAELFTGRLFLCLLTALNKSYCGGEK